MNQSDLSINALNTQLIELAGLDLYELADRDVISLGISKHVDYYYSDEYARNIILDSRYSHYNTISVNIPGAISFTILLDRIVVNGYSGYRRFHQEFLIGLPDHMVALKQLATSYIKSSTTYIMAYVEHKQAEKEMSQAIDSIFNLPTISYDKWEEQSINKLEIFFENVFKQPFRVYLDRFTEKLQTDQQFEKLFVKTLNKLTAKKWKHILVHISTFCTSPYMEPYWSYLYQAAEKNIKKIKSIHVSYIFSKHLSHDTEGRQFILQLLDWWFDYHLMPLDTSIAIQFLEEYYHLTERIHPKYVEYIQQHNAYFIYELFKAERHQDLLELIFKLDLGQCTNNELFNVNFYKACYYLRSSHALIIAQWSKTTPALKAVLKKMV